VAVAIFASGNYLAGTVWPPVVQHYIDSAGWRETYFGIALFCTATVLPLAAAVLRRRSSVYTPTASEPASSEPGRIRPSAAPAAPPSVGVSPAALQALLIVAGLSCCIAMSMPQVHIVAYCGDLGYGAARGAQMLSLMLGFGIVSRLASGWIVDHIGGVRTLLLGSTLQMLALALFLGFDGLVSLYVISALFGLFQGGIVPSYAIIVREYFPVREAGARVGAVFMATLFGMALGGWMSGAVFDLTGSYDAAFVNGLLWNLVNVAIAAWLLRQSRPRLVAAT
jgi:cyanate permease